ncbi:MAG: hypothetical protein OEZ57_08930 [Nitrospirota bacterium]|nr:hypothetical protein [Nitrospirota bacterium]MDH5775025.1 hypothetical protein [Nitrospirota bacterium]
MLSTKTRTHTVSQFLAIGLISLVFLGCQSFQAKNPGELSLKNHDFIGLWDAYNDCQTGFHTQDMQQKLEILHAAPTPISLDDSPIPIPQFIKKLTSSRNSRLAVDPRAMAASCSMHLAEVAYQTHDLDTSLRTWQSIVREYPEPQYAYYVSEATQAIENFSSILPASLSSHDALVR